MFQCLFCFSWPHFYCFKRLIILITSILRQPRACLDDKVNQLVTICTGAAFGRLTGEVMDACFPNGINCNDDVCQMINPGGYAVVG